MASQSEEHHGLGKVSDLLHHHKDAAKDKHDGVEETGAAQQKKDAKNSAEQPTNSEGRIEVGGGSWDPSGKDVTKDTVEDRNAATPHPSAEQDMKKIAEEKKKIGTDHETEKGGNQGNAEAFDK